MTIPIAAALIDEPQRDAEDALERLVDAHLLDSPTPGRYDTHDLLRLYARELGTAGPDRHTALRRALDCQVAAAEQANLLLTADPDMAGEPVVSPHGGFALSTLADIAVWTDAEHANLLAAANQAARTPSTRAVAIRLATALARPLEIRGYWRDVVSLLEHAVPIADDLGNVAGRARSRTDLGYVYLRLGRIDDAIAIVREAVRDWRQVGDQRGESVCLNYLGLAHHELRQTDEAIACHHKALAICRAIGFQHGEAFSLSSLGLCHQRSRQLDEAINYHRQALDTYRKIGNRMAESSVLSNHGWTYHRLGHHDRATSHFHDALIGARDIGLRYTEAEILWGLGQAQHALGRHDQARTYWQHSITILTDIGALTLEEADTLRGQPIPDTPEIIQRNT